MITILFALSLDLALGYAGIITLGHAAFFGAGAYTVGMLAFYGIWTEPITSLMLAALAAAVVGLLSGLVLLRTRGLTLLMLTLCTMALLEEAANMAHAYTGGFDGLPSLPIAPVFGVFEFNPLYANTQYLYSLGVLLVCFMFVRTLVYSPFGQSLTGIRENLLRMHAVGSPVRRRLVICYTISAAIAGIAGGLWAQTNAYVNLSALDLDRAATVLIVLILGGYGRLYGAFIGAVVYLALEHFLAQIYPTAWQLGLGLLLVADRAVRPQRHSGPRRDAVAALCARGAARVMSEIRLETRGAQPHFGALRGRAADRLQARGRRAPRADRPERRRQDHIHQSAHRRVAAERGPRAARRPRHHRQGARPSGSSSASRRTFQINRLFRGLSVLENVCIAVAERVGAARSMFYPAGWRTDIIDESMQLLETLQARRRPRRHRVVRTALWPPAPGRAGDHDRAQARSAAARRARRRRAERGKPHHPRRHRAAARRHRRADHRARHGRGVPLRQARHGDGRAARCSPRARRARSRPTRKCARSISASRAKELRHG